MNLNCTHYDLAEFGKRLRTLRESKEYTQEKIADLLNISREFYGRIERGEKACSVDLMLLITFLFDVSLDYLVLGYDRCSAPTKKELLSVIGQLNNIITKM